MCRRVDILWDSAEGGDHNSHTGWYATTDVAAAASVFVATTTATATCSRTATDLAAAASVFVATTTATCSRTTTDLAAAATATTICSRAITALVATTTTTCSVFANTATFALPFAAASTTGTTGEGGGRRLFVPRPHHGTVLIALAIETDSRGTHQFVL